MDKLRNFISNKNNNCEYNDCIPNIISSKNNNCECGNCIPTMINPFQNNDHKEEIKYWPVIDLENKDPYLQFNQDNIPERNMYIRLHKHNIDEDMIISALFYDPIEIKRLEINKEYVKREIKNLELRNKEIRTLINSSQDKFDKILELKEELNFNLNNINKYKIQLIENEDSLTKLYESNNNVKLIKQAYSFDFCKNPIHKQY